MFLLSVDRLYLLWGFPLTSSTFPPLWSINALMCCSYYRHGDVGTCELRTAPWSIFMPWAGRYWLCLGLGRFFGLINLSLMIQGGIRSWRNDFRVKAHTGWLTHKLPVLLFVDLTRVLFIPFAPFTFPSAFLSINIDSILACIWLIHFAWWKVLVTIIHCNKVRNSLLACVQHCLLCFAFLSAAVRVSAQCLLMCLIGQGR